MDRALHEVAAVEPPVSGRTRVGRAPAGRTTLRLRLKEPAVQREPESGVAVVGHDESRDRLGCEAQASGQVETQEGLRGGGGVGGEFDAVRPRARADAHRYFGCTVREGPFIPAGSRHAGEGAERIGDVETRGLKCSTICETGRPETAFAAVPDRSCAAGQRDGRDRTVIRTEGDTASRCVQQRRGAVQ